MPTNINIHQYTRVPGGGSRISNRGVLFVQTRAKILKPHPLCRNHTCFRTYSPVVSQFTAATDLWISKLAKVLAIIFVRKGFLLAKNHCLTKPDMHIQCVVLGAQGDSSKPPELPLDLPLCTNLCIPSVTLLRLGKHSNVRIPGPTAYWNGGKASVCGGEGHINPEREQKHSFPILTLVTCTCGRSCFHFANRLCQEAPALHGGYLLLAIKRRYVCMHHVIFTDVYEIIT